MVEKGQVKYELVVKAGQVEKEDGYFFQAGPFQITANDVVFDVEFKRVGSLVVFDIVGCLLCSFGGEKSLEMFLRHMNLSLRSYKTIVSYLGYFKPNMTMSINTSVQSASRAHSMYLLFVD